MAAAFGRLWGSDNIFRKIYKAFDETDQPAVAGMTAQPLVITQGAPAVSPDKVAHAKYRLDAIKRHQEQNPKQVTAAHRDEFKAEIREHAHTLIKAGLIDDDQAAAMVRDGKGVTL